ncbi:MAG: hypothetical protein PWQ14_1101, partial [Rikenellaceae bacterium]|nr:hypothetical protein [Rikenellaceae bacterium]
IVLISLLMGNNLKAQNIGISADPIIPDASAGLEIQFTNKGLLIPRVALTSTSSASPITSPATSLLVYNTATAGTAPNNVTPGYYYWTGTKWMRLLAIDDKVSWLLTGNAGTTPTTNFLGTTDGQPLVIRTNNTERARILSNGQVLINRTTAIRSGDLLEAQGNATYPYAINGFTDQASGVGVYGYNSASGGIAILGLTSTGYGVAGSATGGAGVYAEDSSSAGTGEAIYAKNFHASGNGVLAAGNNINPIYITGGVGGAFASTNVGLFGYGNNTSESWGILGRSAAADGIGIVADISATAGTSNGCGVVAFSNQDNGQAVQAQHSRPAGDAIWAVNTASSGTNIGCGIYAQTSQSNGFGVWGANAHTSGTGVVGAGNNQTASYLANGSGGAFTGNAIGVYGYATGSGDDTWGGYFANSGTAYAYVGGRTEGTDYKINGTGTVSTIVKNTAGERVNLYCPEAPEIYFQDYGVGQLVNGKAHIELDPDFAKNVTINEKHPLRVFIQIEDDCYGVYVTNKTKTGFDVIELNGGSSNAKFVWTVTANRADEVDENGNIISKYADVRFGPAPGPLETEETKEVKAINREIKEVESLDKKNININKTKNQ